MISIWIHLGITFCILQYTIKSFVYFSHFCEKKMATVIWLQLFQCDYLLIFSDLCTVTINWIFWGFGLLVGQNNTLETFSLCQWGLWVNVICICSPLTCDGLNVKARQWFAHLNIMKVTVKTQYNVEPRVQNPSLYYSRRKQRTYLKSWNQWAFASFAKNIKLKRK